jgi:TRAP-type C4-dicarboxylate transport system permease small subunit
LGGLDDTAEGTGHLLLGNINTLEGSISKIIALALSLIGVIFLGLLIYGGYIWMTARGNEQQVEKAKNIIINTIIGLVIVVAAYAITVFIGSTLDPKS